MKIVEAINSMISNSRLITDVFKQDQEYFFLYKNKYKWSILLGEDGDYSLFLYPKENRSTEILASLDSFEFTKIPMITYRNSEIKTRESTESFSELYALLSNKIYGVDDILDDIISDDNVDF
jgi:hypothetical protein